MIDRYGQLKIQAQSFAGYCNDLKSRTNQQELKQLADEGRLVPTNNSYYSYWQVHQLHAMKHGEFIIPIDFRQFSWLSVWVNLFERERRRTFATVKETDGVQILSTSQHKEHERRLHTIAERLERHCNLAKEGYYNFLHQLVGLHYEYQHYERYKLADTLEQDLFALVDFMILRLGGDWYTLSEELGQRYSYDKQTFRNINIAIKEHDAAFLVIKNSASTFRAELISRNLLWTISDSDIDALLKLYQDQRMPLFAHATGGMVATGSEEYRTKFRRITKYTNLMSIFVSLEYLIKALYPTVSGTLTETVSSVMQNEVWFSLFKSRRKLLNPATLNQLQAFLTDPDLQGSTDAYWAQTFLVVCLTRNFSAHNFPTEHRYYDNLFGIMLERALASIFYVWKQYHHP